MSDARDDRRLRPRIWTVALFLIAATAGQLVFVAVPLAMLRHSRHASLDGPEALIVSMTAALLYNLVLVVAATGASPFSWRDRLTLPTWRARPADVALVVVAMWGLAEANGAIARSLGKYDGSAFKHIHDAAASASIPLGLVMIVVGSSAGLVEELVFRGYAQSRVRARFGVVAAVVVPALFFGIAHMDLVQGSFAFATGLVLAVVALRTESIATGIYAHAINNCIAFGMTLALASPDDVETSDGARGVVLGVALFVVAALALSRRLPDAQPFIAPAQVRREESRAVRGGLGCGAAFVVAASAVVVAALVVGLLEARSPAKERARTEARALAANIDDKECMEHAIGVNENVRKAFYSACVQRARHTADFCAGVPGALAIMKHRAWAEADCVKRGRGRDDACISLASTIPFECARRGREKKSP